MFGLALDITDEVAYTVTGTRQAFSPRRKPSTA